MRTRVLHAVLTIFALLIAGMLGSSQVQASAVQHQPPEKIFAAVCSTCHGPAGMGGVSWVDGGRANKIAGESRETVKAVIRRGYRQTSMPVFGPDRITDKELELLATWLELNPDGVPAPKTPEGSQVVLNMLDADPFYQDDGTDQMPDTRRVALAVDQYLKVVNTGKTWHTITADEQGIDSGYIGPSVSQDVGYYYAEQKDLARGCVDYHCHIHPYMQTEICTANNTPRAISRVHKNATPPPLIPGTDMEVWVMAQLQQEDVDDKVVGAIQVVNPRTWKVKDYIPNVGNNAHFGWFGKDASGQEMAMVTSFHDNILSYIDVNTKKVITEVPTGAAVAHIMVSPGPNAVWLDTLGGANAVAKVDPQLVEEGLDPNTDLIRAKNPAETQEAPHGMWFCDDGDHFVTANMFSRSIALYSLQADSQISWAPTNGLMPMNPFVMAGDANIGGCNRAVLANLNSNSVSFFDINTQEGTISRVILNGPLADVDGNLKLKDLSLKPVRWAAATIQTSVSPPGSTTHGRYLIVPSKMAFNISFVKLDEKGLPVDVFNFPVGYGSHGIAYGRKSACDSGNPDDACYYVFIGNSYDDYLSVYDLERIENGRMGVSGSSLETVRLEGEAVDRLCHNAGDGLERLGMGCGSLATGPVGAILPALPITVVCPDCRSGVHVGDVPLRLTVKGKYAYFKKGLWFDLPSSYPAQPGETREAPPGVVELDMEMITNTGAFNLMTRPLPFPWGVFGK